MPLSTPVTFFLRHLDDFDDVGVVRHAGYVRVLVQGAKALAKREVLFRGQVLIAKEEHQVLVECLVDFGESLVVQRTR